MRKIQSKILPEDWLELVTKFNIKKSSLSGNNKIIACYLKQIILEEKEKSLSNQLLQILIKYIVFEIDFLEYYDDLPRKLVKDAFSEINKGRGINLDRKLHSLFVEFMTYQDLYKQDYIIVESQRTQGSCDLVMSKDDKNYNFEVKYKESSDVGKSRLYDYMDGYSLLEQNEFLRGKTFEINLKVDSLNYSNLQNILSEIDIFIDKQKDIYNGENLQIFDSTKRGELNRGINQVTNYINSFIIETIDDVDKLVCDIFIKKNGHLTKLIKKSGRYESKDNFTGCLVWSIPFHMKIDNDKIKNAFKKIKLDFDLFIYTSGVNKEEFNFFIPKSKGEKIEN